MSLMLCLCAALASAWTFGCGPDLSDTSRAFVNGTSNTPPDRVCRVSITIVQAATDNSTFTDTQGCDGASLPNGAVNQTICVINAHPGTHTSLVSRIRDSFTKSRHVWPEYRRKEAADRRAFLGTGGCISAIFAVAGGRHEA